MLIERMVISMEGCTVSWDGSASGTYFVPCDQVKFIDDNLVNTSSETILLYRSVNGNNSYNSNIVMPALSNPRYYSGNTYYYVTNASNIRYNAISYYYREIDYLYLGLIFFIFFYILTRLFKRGV